MTWAHLLRGLSQGCHWGLRSSPGSNGAGSASALTQWLAPLRLWVLGSGFYLGDGWKPPSVPGQVTSASEPTCAKIQRGMSWSFNNQARVHHPTTLPHPLHLHYITAFNPGSRGSDEAGMWTERRQVVETLGTMSQRAHHKHAHITMDFL